MARQKVKWRSEEERMLGTSSDAAVAIALKRSPASVHKRRSALGIPAFDRKRGRQRYWTEAEQAMLGQFPDTELAKKFGVTAGAVRQRRHRLGIDSFDSKRKIVFGWTFMKKLPQPEFFDHIKQSLSESLGIRVTLKTIADATHYSESRMQKWAAPGGGQEPLSLAIRHHIWLIAKFPKGHT